MTHLDKFHGTHTALVTPFFENGTIDWKNFEKHLDRQIEAQIQGLVPCGTTGESPTLTSDEKKKLILTTVRKVSQTKQNTVVIAGTGSNDTKKTLEQSKQAQDLGVDALLIVTPYYNKPSQNSLIDHYTAIADKISIPIFLYNVPGRTGVSLSAETVLTLSKHRKIFGIKEATGNLALFTEMRTKVANNDFIFLSGDDVTYWPFLTCGGNGVISVASNVIPKTFVHLFNLWKQHDFISCLNIHETLAEFHNSLFYEANPVPIKQLMADLKLISAKTRMPLGKINHENHLKMKKAWNKIPRKFKNS